MAVARQIRLLKLQDYSAIVELYFRYFEFLINVTELCAYV